MQTGKPRLIFRFLLVWRIWNTPAIAILSAAGWQFCSAGQNLGNGGWFGAFEGSKLVGSLGLYVENGVARYQSVGTHKKYRGRGIAGALLAFAAHSIAEQHKVDQFVIIADQDSNAHRLYLKSEFDFHSTEHALMRAPQSDPD